MPIKRTGKEGKTCVICAVVKLVTGISYEISLINFFFCQCVLLFLGFGCENYPVEYSFEEQGGKDRTTNSVTISDRKMLRRKKTKEVKKVICTECKTLPNLEPCQHQPLMVLENKDEVRNVLEKRNDVISKLESAEATLVKKKAEASKKTLNPASNKKISSITKPRKEITYHQEPVSANMFARGDIIWAQEWTFIEPVKHSADDMPKVQEDLKTFGSGELGPSASKSTAFLHRQEQLVNGDANITNIRSSGNVPSVQDKTSNGVWSKSGKGATVRSEPAEGQLVRFSPGLQTRPLSNGIGLVAYIQPEGPFEKVRYGINEFVNFLKLSHLRVNQPTDANHRRFLKNTVGLVNSWLTSRRMLTPPVESEMPWLGVLVQLRHDYKKYQSGTSAERQTYLSLQNTIQNFRNWLDAFPSHRQPDLNPAPAYTVPTVPDAIKGYTGDQAKTSKQKASRLPRPVNASAEKEHLPASQNGKSSETVQNKASTSPASASNNVSTRSKWWPFKSKGTTKAAKDAGMTTVTTQKKTRLQDSLKPDSATEADPSVIQSKTSRDVEKAPVETSSSWNKVKNIVRAKTRNEGPEHLPEKNEIHREPSKIGEYLRRKLRPTRRLAAASAPPDNDREMQELIEKVNEMVIQEKQPGAAAQELKASQSPVITNKTSRENSQRPTQPRLNATPEGQPEIIGTLRNPQQTITATASDQDIEAISKSQGKQLEKVLSKILEKPPTSAETSSAATPLDGQALSTATNHSQLNSVATPTGGVTTDAQANQQCSCDHCLGLDHVCGAENKAAANEDAKPAAAPQSSSTPKKKHRRNKRKGRNLKWKTSSPSVAPSSTEDAQNETFEANHGVEDPLNDSIGCSTVDTTLNDTLNSTLNTTANDTDAENQDTMKMTNTDKATTDKEKDVPAKGNSNPAEAVVTSVVETSFHEYLVTENRVNYSDMSIMPGHADRVNRKKMANNVKVKVKTKGTPNKHLDKDLNKTFNKQWNVDEGFSNAEDDGGNNEGKMVIDAVEGGNAESVEELRSVKVADVVVPDFDGVVLDNRGYNMVPEEIIRKEGSNRLKELEDLYAISSPEKGDKRGRQKKKKNNKKGWTLALTNPHNMR